MAVTKRTPRTKSNAGPIGASPTNSQKLIYIANKLGLGALAQMQGTTMSLFDTQPLVTNAGRQVLTFFDNTGNRSRNFSNFQNGSLQAGEAMVMEEVKFWLVVTSGTDLSQDTTSIVSMIEISAAPTTAYPNVESFQDGLLSLTIANSQVIKDYQLSDVNPSFNKRNTGISLAEIANTASLAIIASRRTHGSSTVDLEAPPVLPPNQKFKFTVEIPPTGTVPANTFIMMSVGRFGSIFAAKTTL